LLTVHKPEKRRPGSGSSISLEFGEVALSEGRYFENISAETFRSKTIRIEKDRMIAFAQEFDPQQQHVSEQAVAASQFG
jgi:hypothetical protein